MTPFFQAVKMGDPKLIEPFWQLSQEKIASFINYTDHCGDTPLGYAVTAGESKIVNQLVAHWAVLS